MQKGEIDIQTLITYTRDRQTDRQICLRPLLLSYNVFFICLSLSAFLYLNLFICALVHLYYLSPFTPLRFLPAFLGKVQSQPMTPIINAKR